ncbi:MAG TPA: ribose-5-phosphate isomerase RpiA, partial [Armatimonadetes bacterium]|nr:ribose-5-phosphate isomerase RpiA [Armatimonadota bacterium]
VGLGTGTTARYAVLKLAQLHREGFNFIGIPTSRETERLAREQGLPLTTLEDCPQVDLSIDGADEVDAAFNLIKGGGGALVREKIVAQASAQVIIVVDETKLVKELGRHSRLPVEVVPFGWRSVARQIETLGGVPLRRTLPDGTPLVTDNGNYLLDCRFPGIPNPTRLEAQLNALAGVVDCGLFIGLADVVIVGYADQVEVLQRPEPKQGYCPK